MDISLFTSCLERLTENCKKVIVGKDDKIKLVLVSFICSGHVLLEDVPGTGKTMLLRAFARSVGGDFTRIQFTPDLLPGDITGVNFFNPKKSDFEFRRGPLFSGLVLADEINRATPRTQSALLEAMEERQISVDGETYPLDEPFMVMATQNPLESYGVFPLPEAQLDRFFMRLSLGYMTREQEISVMGRRSAAQIAMELERVVSAEEIAQMKEQRAQVEVCGDVSSYIMDVVEKTRTDSRLACGVSTRGAIALYRAAQAYAALSGREYVIPEDVRDLAPAVLSHRTGSSAAMKDSEGYIEKLVSGVLPPTEEL